MWDSSDGIETTLLVRIIALYCLPVIFRCVIRISAEFSYLGGGDDPKVRAHYNKDLSLPLLLFTLALFQFTQIHTNTNMLSLESSHGISPNGSVSIMHQ